MVADNPGATVTVTDNVSIDQLQALSDALENGNDPIYTTIEDIPGKLFSDTNNVGTISSFIEAGVNVVVSDTTEPELLTAINEAIKVGENRGTLTATVEGAISALSAIEDGTADVLNYLVTDAENPSPDELNALKQKC